jgi:hypothetical protein
MVCEKCESEERKSTKNAYKWVVCVICGKHSKNKKEYAKWIEGVCVKCQKKYGVA